MSDTPRTDEFFKRRLHPDFCINQAMEFASQLERENGGLLAALENFVERYTALVNSGDAGNWNPETDAEVIQARAAISKARQDLHGARSLNIALRDQLHSPKNNNSDAEVILGDWVDSVRDLARELGLTDQESRGSSFDWAFIKTWVKERQ